MKYKSLIFLLIIILSSSQFFAQGGSIYTRFGKGDLVNDFFGRNVGLNGAANSVSSGDHISLNNPAGLYELKLTTFETGFDYNGYNISGNDNSILYSKTSFTGFVFAVPLERDLGIVMSAGLLPLTNVSYEIVEDISETSYDPHSFTYSGQGGISKLFVSTSFKTPYDFVIGGTFNYYTGNIEYTGKVQFESGSSYQDGSYVNKQGHHGLGATIGIISPDLSSLLGGAISNFRIGGYYDFVADLTTDTTITSVTQTGDAIITTGTMDTEYPYTLSLGTGFTISEDYNIFINYLFQPWSKYKFGDKNVENLQDMLKLSAGFEYKKKTARKDNFWDNFVLRFGAGYQQTQLKLRNEAINMMSVSAGFGFPIGQSGNIDIGFMYGKRGTKNKNLFSEDVLQATFSINFGELWFIRRER